MRHSEPRGAIAVPIWGT